MDLMRREIALVAGIALLSACSSQRPGGCVTHDDPEVIGAWVHTGDPPVRYTCQPQRVVFRSDGSFEAQYATESRALDDNCPSGSTESGSWSAGKYCASELFLPRTVIHAEPPFRNTHVVVYGADRIKFIGQASSWYDAEYVREL